MNPKKEGVYIPAHIFNKRLGSLESIVKYLKENGLSYSEISCLINRDQRTVWNVYRNASEKFPGKFESKNSVVSIPCSVLKDRKLSVLESLSVFLKEKENCSHKETAMLLNRDVKTIWTAYNRAKLKT